MLLSKLYRKKNSENIFTTQSVLNYARTIDNAQTVVQNNKINEQNC